MLVRVSHTHEHGRILSDFLTYRTWAHTPGIARVETVEELPKLSSNKGEEGATTTPGWSWDAASRDTEMFGIRSSTPPSPPRPLPPISLFLSLFLSRADSIFRCPICTI